MLAQRLFLELRLPWNSQPSPSASVLGAGIARIYTTMRVIHFDFTTELDTILNLALDK